MTDESYDPHARMHESFPRVDSGTQMAGDVVTFPIPMSQSDTNRNISSSAPDYSKTNRDWRGNPKPGVVVKGPGAN